MISWRYRPKSRGRYAFPTLLPFPFLQEGEDPSFRTEAHGVSLQRTRSLYPCRRATCPLGTSTLPLFPVLHPATLELSVAATSVSLTYMNSHCRGLG